MMEISAKLIVEPHRLPLCDMVMEGGVTSGVVYPKAAVQLSKQFRLKNIGGTSVGALAAAVTAAAEVGRIRDPDSNPGYRRLANLPDELQGPGFSRPGVSRLFDLFQPQPEMRPLFNIFASTLNRGSIATMIGHALLTSVKNRMAWFSGVTIALLLILFLLGTDSPVDWIVALLFSAVCGIAGVGYALGKLVTGPFVKSGYGMCSGYIEGSDEYLKARDQRESLTLWLSRLINECAGKKPDDAPLTFGELWCPTADERSLPPAWVQAAGISTWRYVDLQVISTNVTHGRPYRFPNEDHDQKLFFKPAELAKLFPKNVVDHLVAHAQDYAASEKSHEPKTLPDGLLMLPAPSDMPVVFAARLSLSFPFLLSAIPLYAVDYEQQNYALRRFERCWFSDGGICSNFPIHFFDSAVPLWPTFGIKLEAERKHHKIGSTPAQRDNRWFLPYRNEEGRGDSFFRFDEATSGSASLAGFISAILNSARHWQNHMLVRAPGVRDRVLRIFLKKDEGGLNLNMSQAILEDLTAAGAEGAEKLASRFGPGSADPMNFDNHRWVRLRNLTAVMEKDLAEVHKALRAAAPGVVSWKSLLDAAIDDPEKGRYGITAQQQQKMEAMLGQLRAISEFASDSPDMLQKSAPRRAPVIRIVPDI